MNALRRMLWPFSWLYAAVVRLRNGFYDRGWLSAESYDFPVIAVGNLSVGGTGKTPMVEYLIRMLQSDYRLATLSRGYKRQTKGFYLLKGEEEVRQTGDEPLQFKTKFKQTEVAVDEDRKHGIARLRALNPPPEIILLDDAFQHRKVKAGLYILLTTYRALYVNDSVLPAGNLREPRSGAKRADIVVVTKCPPDLSVARRKAVRDQLKLATGQSLFFSAIAYEDYITNGQTKILLDELKKKFCLVTGIARPDPLVEFLTDRQLRFVHRRFPDHHNFSTAEITTLAGEKFILTTEKDFMRLRPYLPAERLFYLPIRQTFLSGEQQFKEQIDDFLRQKGV